MKNRFSLPSLLALAAGASALPIAAEAAIIYTDLGTQTVGFFGDQLASLLIDLPGTADLNFAIGSGAGWRVAVNQAAGYVNIGRQTKGRSLTASGAAGTNVAFRTNSGVQWTNAGQINPLVHAALGNIASSNGMAIRGPGAFSNKSLLFTFKNSGAGNLLQYGWVGMSGASVWAGFPGNMSVTLSGWAYDDSGTKIAAGAIPEPASAALAMGGALVLGVAGLRQWRKRKVATLLGGNL